VVGNCISVNDELKLPSTPGGRNWLQIDLELDWNGEPPDIGPSELPGGEAPPKDHDGDGTVEDVTGSGDVNIFDTQELFNNLDNETLQENPELFNFQREIGGKVTIFDVQSLFFRVVTA